MGLSPVGVIAAVPLAAGHCPVQRREAEPERMLRMRRSACYICVYVSQVVLAEPLARRLLPTALFVLHLTPPPPVCRYTPHFPCCLTDWPQHRPCVTQCTRVSCGETVQVDSLNALLVAGSVEFVLGCTHARVGRCMRIVAIVHVGHVCT